MNKAADRLLAIDVGTQSLRALVFDLDGTLCARARVPIPACAVPQPGWAEQNPDVYWRAMATACAALWSEHRQSPAAIAGMALTTQRATALWVDEQGRPLRNAIVWMDRRRAQVVPRLGAGWRIAFRLAGVASIVRGFQAAARDNWIAHEQPALWARVHKSLLLSGYLSFKLTGQFVDAVGAQVGYIPFDYKRRRWAGRRDWKWRALATRAAQLPELVSSGRPLGSLTEVAAAALGLAPGLTVIAAGADKACEVLGSACTAPDRACVSLGTAANVNVCDNRYREVIRYVPAYPAAMPNAYNCEVQIDHGFWLVSWFKRELGQPEQALAAQRGVAPETLFEEMIADIPPGNDGLMLQPTWSPGVRIPGPEARGAIIGFREWHSRAHLYRAILEGLAYALREGKARINRRGSREIRGLRVVGGGAQSDAAMQIIADVFGLPAERPPVFEASGLGAAINAAVGLGFYPDHAAAVTAMTRPGQVFTPRPDAQAIYDRLYRRVYRRLYARLRPLYRGLRNWQ